MARLNLAKLELNAQIYSSTHGKQPGKDLENTPTFHPEI